MEIDEKEWLRRENFFLREKIIIGVKLSIWGN